MEKVENGNDDDLLYTEMEFKRVYESVFIWLRPTEPTEINAICLCTMSQIIYLYYFVVAVSGLIVYKVFLTHWFISGLLVIFYVLISVNIVGKEQKSKDVY